MGTWDATSFGNDTANDWAYDLIEGDDFTHIESTLDQALGVGDDYLDADVAVEAVAAAEMVAWLNGNPAAVNAYTEKIANWVHAHAVKPSGALVQKALMVVDLVQSETSELAELWEGDPDWTNAMADLKRRLSA